MSSKYYTPSLDEFYIGFECEFFNNMQGKEWEKEVCDTDTISIAFDIHEHGTIEWDDDFSQTFRVKYLDSEDIENLGFMQDSLYSYINGDWIIEVNINDLTDTLDLYCVSDLRFKGYIKNKSELKQVLKMIGVIE